MKSRPITTPSMAPLNQIRALLVLVLSLLLLAGCASRDTETLPEEEYYEQARQSMNAGNFESAQRNLESLETYYPFGRYAEQAQLDLIFARYQNLDLQGARSAADRFLRLNPQSENADYALYMRGVASYNMDLGLAARYFPIEVAGRDPGEQRQAFNDFQQLVNRYPDSEYAPDARQRMIAIRNRFAGGEIEAAQYYIKRQAYIAALNRAKGSLKTSTEPPQWRKHWLSWPRCTRACDSMTRNRIPPGCWPKTSRRIPPSQTTAPLSARVSASRTGPC